jgi:dipeptidase E
MKRIVLFSTPSPTNIDTLLALIFPKEISNKMFAYMPSDGENIKEKYVKEWREYAQRSGAKFELVNNSIPNAQGEIDKLMKANVLVMTGGNTFKLLSNLRKSGLDKAIKEFSGKNEFILAGFSAGALVLTPTIEVCNLPNYDKNEVGLKDLTGLGVVSFEVFPHYSEQEYSDLLNKYKNQTSNVVREITNEDFIVLDL